MDDSKKGQSKRNPDGTITTPSGGTLIPYPKGVSGNPGGKPKGARDRLNVRFLGTLLNDFEQFGEAAIVAARENDPVSYVKIVASLLPKQIEETKPLDDMEDAELLAAIAFLRTRITGDAGEGTGAPPEPSQAH